MTMPGRSSGRRGPLVGLLVAVVLVLIAGTAGAVVWAARSSDGTPTAEASVEGLFDKDPNKDAAPPPAAPATTPPAAPPPAAASTVPPAALPAVDPCSGDAAFTAVVDRTDPGLNDDGYFARYELRGCVGGYVVGIGHPVAETDWSYLVLASTGSGWSGPELYGVGSACGESGLPEAVDELMDCVPPPDPYAVYTNPRFGFACEVPAGYVAAGAASNGDGQRFTSADGSRSVTCSGSNTHPGETPELVHGDTLAELAAGGDEVTFHRLEGNTSTISGFTADGDIFYGRTVMGSGSANTLYWLYPAAAREELDAAVEHSVATFRPGEIDESH